MRKGWLAPFAGAALLCFCSPLSATPVFNECPTVGNATSCANQFVLAPSGAVSLTGFSMSSFTMTGRGIADLSADGPFAHGSYSGPDSTFSNIDHNPVSVNPAGGLTGGQNIYFALKASSKHGNDTDDDDDGDDDDENDQKPVPEPSSMLLFGTGLVALGGFLRRRMRI